MQDRQAVAPDNTAVRTALWRALHMEVDSPPHVIEDDIGLSFPLAGGTDPYRTWDADLPDELLTLCNHGSTMVSDYCQLDPEQVPAAVTVIHERGESAVDDCALLEELLSLYDKPEQG